MLKRLLTTVTAIAAVSLGTAHAQQAPDYGSLKKLLEKKFAPAQTRSLGDTQPAPTKNDYQWLNGAKTNGTPGTQPSPTPPPSDTPDKRSELLVSPVLADATGSWWDSLYNYVITYLGGEVPGGGTLPEPAGGKQDAGGVSGGDKAAAGESNVRKAPEGSVPIAKKNSFVIQLKPNATEEQIAALLAKYNLNVTKIIGELGVITVEQAEPPPSAAPEADDDTDATRGLGGGAPAAAPAEKLQKILEPQIIKDLRKEPIVDAAIVNSTIGAKVLPKPAGASLLSGGKSYAWRWTPGDGIDGNWGLKTLRMPPVWTILSRFRQANPGEVAPKIGVIDAGFGDNPAVPFKSTNGVQKLTVLRPDCNTHHAMHVSGIIGARQGDTPGIDGMIPDARMDAVAISNQAANEAGELGVDQLWELQTLLFDEVLGKTMDYLVDNVVQPDNLRVINISLGYNFLAKKLIGSANLDDVEGLKLHIHHQASIIRRMAQRVEDKILFVVAAGNDSDDRTEPLPARWASPFAWAGTYEGVSDKPASNILVVEASDRNGARASFSNVGGQVSAPGVDIMSTLVPGNVPFAVCSGTSQAAPYVSALAAIMFELDPSKKPSEIVDLIRSTATPAPEGKTGAPEADALEAVLHLAGTKALLTDLDHDGKVGPADLKLFKNELDEIREAAATATAFKDDINGDGIVDGNECHWPLIDFNGSGSGATQPADFKRLGGLFRSDLSVMALAWGDKPETYDTALADSGLNATESADTLTASTMSDADKACLRTDGGKPGGTVVAVLPTTGEPSGTGAATPAAGGETPAAGTGRPPDDTAAGPGAAPTSAPAPAPSTPVTAEAPGNAPEEPTTRGLAATETPAPEPSKVKAMVLKAVETMRRLNPRLRITINPATGLPSSISGLLPRPAVTDVLGASVEKSSGEQSEEETRRAVEGFFATGGLTAAFPTENKNAKTEYVGRRRDPDFPNRYIANVQQKVGSVPVFGSGAKLTVEGLAGVTKYVGTPSTVAISNTDPAISEADAIAAARASLAVSGEGEEIIGHGHHAAAAPADAEAKAQLIIYDPALIEKRPGRTRLAWMVDIDSYRVFVDAHTKDVFRTVENRASGATRMIYDLDLGKTFPGKLILDESQGMHIDNMPLDAEIAFRNTGDVRDYYFLVFGRNSFDDNDGPGPNGGAPLKSFIRYSNIKDAYWCPSKSFECPEANVMVYGPGYANSLDIVAHEMTHGVISQEKNLLYMNEPGAVNESLADIFGSLVEMHARIPYGNWMIGDLAPGFSAASPLRNMGDPQLHDADGKSMFDRTQRYAMVNRGQPDNYGDRLTTDDKLCASTRYQDNGCVHFNSGILNKFAYLISEGGEHRGVTVTGIGRFKLARIAYRTMTAQLNESSGLIEAADGFALSCLELSEAGVGGITTSDCEQVFQAEQATGLVLGSS